MTEDTDHTMDPQTALGHADQMGRRVRRKARWHGWSWLVVAIITPAFLLGTRSEAISRPIQFWVSVAFVVVAGGLAIWETRRGVMSRETARIDGPLTGWFMGAMFLVVALTIIFEPEGLTAWYVAAAFVPVVPALVAAWRILRR